MPVRDVKTNLCDLDRPDRVHRCGAKTFTTVQVGQFEHDADAREGVSGPFDQAARGRDGAPGGEYIVENENAGTGRQLANFEFEPGRTVLEVVFLGEHGARKFSALAHGQDGHVGRVPDGGSQQKAACLDSGDGIELSAVLVGEVVDDRAEGDGVSENRIEVRKTISGCGKSG
jgi:hypothetical protein